MPDFSLISGTFAKAVYVFCSEPHHSENTLHTRMFGDYYGVPEDPAIGSVVGCLGAYLVKNHYFSPDLREITNRTGVRDPSPFPSYLPFRLRGREYPG